MPKLAVPRKEPRYSSYRTTADCVSGLFHSAWRNVHGEWMEDSIGNSIKLSECRRLPDASVVASSDSSSDSPGLLWPLRCQLECRESLMGERDGHLDENTC